MSRGYGCLRLAAATLVALAGFLVGAGQALASAGCDVVNAGGLDATGAENFSGSVNAVFGGGDTLQITFTGAPTPVWLNDYTASPSFAVWSGIAPTSTSYVIPSSGSRLIAATWGGGSSGTNTITATCTAAPAPTVTSITPNGGPTTGGTSVTISGTGFIGADSVSFGSTSAASFTVDSATSITATSPAGSGTVDVTVATGGGSSATSAADQFTYTQQAPTVGLSSSANPVQAGSPVTFTATVSGSGLTPTGTVTFTIDGVTGSPVTLAGGAASLITSSLSVGSHTVVVAYGGDPNFTSGSSTTLTQVVSQQVSSVGLSSSANPVEAGSPVTFTATVSGTALTPTGTVTFTIDGVPGAAVTLAGGVASLTTSSLGIGSHTIIAAYGGDANFTASSSAPLTQTVDIPADSVTLGLLQQKLAPLAAKTSGNAISSAVGGAIGDAFSDNGSGLTVGPNGFAVNFWPEPQVTAELDDTFGIFDHGLPVDWKWGAWADMRGTFWDGNGSASGLDGAQFNFTGGISYKLTDDFLVGVVGGYEHFDYDDAALAGTLSGDGGSIGSYLGWRLGDNLQLDAALVWSGIAYDAEAGAATGSFNGSRWLLSAGLTGSHELGSFVLEPSARVFGLWEDQEAWTDSLATEHAAYGFATGRVSAGAKLALPWLTDDGAVITPFAGLFADYDFTDSSVVGIADGPSARLTSGLGFSSGSGLAVSIDGEVGGLGADALNWSVRGHAGLAF